MAINRSDVAAGTGGVGLGVLTGEVTRQGVERDMVSPALGGAAVGGVTAGSVGLVVADLTGVVQLPPQAPALLGGLAVGTLGWYGGRAAGIAPRITAGIPEEVDLTAPLISAGVVTAIGLGAASASRLLL